MYLKASKGTLLWSNASLAFLVLDAASLLALSLSIQVHF